MLCMGENKYIGRFEKWNVGPMLGVLTSRVGISILWTLDIGHMTRRPTIDCTAPVCLVGMSLFVSCPPPPPLFFLVVV